MSKFCVGSNSQSMLLYQSGHIGLDFWPFWKSNGTNLSNVKYELRAIIFEGSSDEGIGD